MFKIIFVLLLTASSLAHAAGECRLHIGQGFGPSELTALAKMGYGVASLRKVAPKIEEQLKDLSGYGAAGDFLVYKSWFPVGVGLAYKIQANRWMQIDFARTTDLTHPKDFPHCAQAKRDSWWAYEWVMFGEPARARLNDFYSTRQLEPGLGTLLLNLDLYAYGQNYSADDKQSLRKTYAELVARTRSVWNETEGDVLDKTEALRSFLLQGPLHMYDPTQNHLGSVLVDGFYLGANCEAQSQLFAGLVADAKIDFGPDYRFGLRIFNDHIEPVLIGKNGYTNLISGEVEKKTLAPIYAPDVLVWAYLNNLGRATDEELTFKFLLDRGPLIPNLLTVKSPQTKSRFKFAQTWRFANRKLPAAPVVVEFKPIGASHDDPKKASRTARLVGHLANLATKLPKQTAFGGAQSPMCSRAGVCPRPEGSPGEGGLRGNQGSNYGGGSWTGSLSVGQPVPRPDVIVSDDTIIRRLGFEISGNYEASKMSTSLGPALIMVADKALETKLKNADVATTTAELESRLQASDTAIAKSEGFRTLLEALGDPWTAMNLSDASLQSALTAARLIAENQKQYEGLYFTLLYGNKKLTKGKILGEDTFVEPLTVQLVKPLKALTSLRSHPADIFTLLMSANTDQLLRFASFYRSAATSFEVFGGIEEAYVNMGGFPVSIQPLSKISQPLAWLVQATLIDNDFQIEDVKPQQIDTRSIALKHLPPSDLKPVLTTKSKAKTAVAGELFFGQRLKPEVYLAILLAQPRAVLSHPAIQALNFLKTSPLVLNSFSTVFMNGRSFRDAYTNLWALSPILINANVQLFTEKGASPATIKVANAFRDVRSKLGRYTLRTWYRGQPNAKGSYVFPSTLPNEITRLLESIAMSDAGGNESRIDASYIEIPFNSFQAETFPAGMPWIMDKTTVEFARMTCGVSNRYNDSTFTKCEGFFKIKGSTSAAMQVWSMQTNGGGNTAVLGCEPMIQ